MSFEMIGRAGAACCLVALSGTLFAAGNDPWIPIDPGKPKVSIKKGAIRLGDRAFEAFFSAPGQLDSVRNGFTSATTALNENCVELTSRTGEHPALKLISGPKLIHVGGDRKSASESRRLPAEGVEAVMGTEDGKLRIRWRALMRTGDTYVRQEVQLSAVDSDEDIANVTLVDLKSPNCQVVGKTSGSPVVLGDLYFGLEHPMSVSLASSNGATCSMHRALPLRKGQTATYTSIVGAVASGQLRRGFLYYIERERAHPYRPFLHYNSWYDIGYFTPYTADECVDRINKFGQELTVKRGVKLSSFLFDDGWDNYQTVWDFNKGFPKGFLPLKEAAAKYKAGPGVWLSPWGGYGGPRDQRLKHGKSVGMEVDSQGYALSGPSYYKRFHEVTQDFVTRQGINQFKFDGTGSPDKTYPGSSFDSDFEAAIQLIKDLRKARPDLFVNLTTGTWPSPFWLQYADSTWRGGSDHSFAGVGSWRQKWITYRDGDTYHGVVQRGPLYPINSLMLHGIIYAKNAQHLSNDPENDFKSEVRDYFGCGTQLQEMYITPDLLSQQNWDDLAEAAKWSQANSQVLRDNHWIGGDPSRLEVYGWASWTPSKAILVLRNPSDKQQAYSVDIETALELPQIGIKRFSGKSPWKEDASLPATEFVAGKSKVIELKPFEVRTLELTPIR